MISVVVPVYNAEAVLPVCVGSILCQTLTDFELLLVDDGSSDGSGKLCEQLAQTDKRVRCIHQPNRGQAAARLAGVMESRGEWLTFVDDDDTLIPTALQELASCTNNDIDIVLGNGRSLVGESRDMIPIEDFRHLTVKGEGSIGLIWGSMYRRSCITPYLFDVPSDIRTGEDYIFWLRLVFQSEKPVRVLYNNVYRKGRDSFSSTFKWTAEYAGKIHSLRKASIPEQVRRNYMEEMVADRVDNLFSVAIDFPKSSWIHSDFYRELQTDIQAAHIQLPFKRRVFLWLPARWLRVAYSKFSNLLALLRR
ncbi:MAG: glycosyltransferase family 2 protein [Bacteroidaceae bacterium]|nr:glycosyltransferase family 2 protein [Bacteroidaceae bacterium]